MTSDEAAHRPHLDVIVDNDQLSLAIGKRGLNVRLAAELIGAKIDIKSEEEVKGEVADALARMLQEAMAESRAQTNVHDIENMPAEWADMLEDAGYDDLDSVINASRRGPHRHRRRRRRDGRADDRARAQARAGRRDADERRRRRRRRRRRGEDDEDETKQQPKTKPDEEASDESRPKLP